MKPYSFSNIFITILSFALFGCKEPSIKPIEQYYSVSLPILNPGFPLNIEQDSLVYTSSLLSLGTLNPKLYGICYGQKTNPTVFDQVEISNTKLDTLPFTYNNKVKNLTKGTTYQVRSFVITAKDTIYGNNNFFRTPGANEWYTRLGGGAIPTAVLAPRDTKNSQIATAFNEQKIFLMFQSQNRIFEYDVQKYTWSEKKQLPSKFEGNITKYSFMANGKAYYGILQKTNDKVENEFWEYDIKTDNWRNILDQLPIMEQLPTFGFNDKNLGYILNLSNENSWKLNRFDPTKASWQMVGDYFKNETITNVLSDGSNTFAITKSNMIYKYSQGQWDSFLNIATEYPNQGKNGYFGWVLDDKLFLGEYEPNAFEKPVKVIKSIDISNKSINSISTSFSAHLGAYQSSKKMFFGNFVTNTTAIPYVMSEYYPK